MKRSIILISLLCLMSGLNAQSDIASFISGPHSSDLAKSEDGTLLGWVTNVKGVRSIHSYDIVKDSMAQHFTSGTDDGQVIRNLQLDAVGGWIYFNRGSGPNRQGELANPLSSALYPTRQLLRVNVRNNQLDTLGEYSNYTLSPDGDFLLIPDRNVLYKLESSTKKIAKLVSMRGAFSDVEIAPDGQSFVFVSNRGDHSFIGYVSFNSDRINWMAPGVDKDGSPHFSPDGNQVCFLRLPGNQNGYLDDITSGQTFKVMVYDFSTQTLDTIWTSPDGAGGFAQYYHADPLRWTRDNHIVFYSEHEGFMNLYQIRPDGTELKSLASGPCEIEHSDVSMDGTRVIYSSNCNDIDRRDLFSYHLTSGELSRITSTTDIETNPIYVSRDNIAYLKGGPSTPTSVFYHGNDDKMLSDPIHSEFPKQEFIIPDQVVFKAADGWDIHGQLFVNGTARNKPAVIFMHGGPIRQMLLGFHYSGYYANAYAFNQYLASRGFVVLSVNFRAGIGYGRDFRRAPHQGPRGASEYQDILAAAKYLQSHPSVDSSRIGLWGGSYGGFLTALGLARNSEIFKAGVDFHGVHDWAWRAEDFSEGGFWGINEALMKEAFASSPVSSVDTWTSPVLFVHGDDDRNVMFGQTVDLVHRLREKGVEHEILVFPDEVHGFYRWESWLQAFTAAAEFFERRL